VPTSLDLHFQRVAQKGSDENDGKRGWQAAGIRCCNAFALLSPGGSANPGLIVATVGAYSENGPVGADIDPRRVRLIARRR
jgi:hypothetical protein